MNLLITFLVFFVLAGNVPQQESDPSKSTKDTKENPQEQKKDRDPFQESPLMRKEAWRQGAGNDLQTAKRGLPKMVLRAFIKIKDKPAAALLEVDEKEMFVVRAGHEIGLVALGAEGRIIVETVGDAGMKVRLEPLGRVVHIR